MKYKLLTLLILLLPLLAGCIKEDQSVCTTPVAFQCRFDFNMQGTDQFSELVNKVDLYIFDTSGTLVLHLSETKPSFPKDYVITTPPMEQGTYNAVLYGTVNDNNGVAIGSKQGNLSMALVPMQEGESRSSDLRMMLNSIAGHSSKDLEAVLHGRVEQFTVTNESKTHPVSFIRNTNVIELNLEGLEYLAAGVSQPSMSDVTVRIESNNKAFLYDNSIDPELGKAIYTPFSQRYNAGVLTTESSVLRLFKEHSLALKIYEEDKLIWQLNLIEEILKSPNYITNEDLDREDRFIIKMKVTTAGDITIVVNGWTTTTAGEIIG